MGNAGGSETAVFALDPFVGSVPLREDDVLFAEMLNARIGAEHVSHADEILDNLCAQLETNNRTTSNFQKLLRVVLRRMRETHALARAELSDELAARLANTLFVSRVFLRYLVQMSADAEQLCATHLLVPGEEVGAVEGGLVGELFRALVDLLIDLPREPHTVALLTEASLFAQTLLCAQMFFPLAEPPVALLASTLCSTYRSDQLAHALLTHHLRSPAPAPAGAAEDGKGSGSHAEAGGRRWGLLHVASLLPAMLSLPRTLLALLFATAPHSTAPCLFSASLCLLLVLSQDLPARLRPLAGGGRAQVARRLASIVDSADAADAGAEGLALPASSGRARPGGAAGADLEMVGGAGSPGNPGGPGGVSGPAALDCGSVPFPLLFETICAQLPAETEVLLLYHLLHTNRRFLRYVLSRTDVDTLLLPLLQALYAMASASEQQPTSGRLYLLLIVLLILSQDRALSDSAFEITLPRVPWYTEGVLTHISPGSLTVCVLCRLVHAQLSSAQRRDPYVSSNCLAVMANLSLARCSLHPHACQALTALWRRLQRRQDKLSARIAAAAEAEAEAQASGQAHARSGAAAESIVELRVQLGASAEWVRTLLELTNALLSSRLAQNLPMVYALLESHDLLPSPVPGGSGSGGGGGGGGRRTAAGEAGDGREELYRNLGAVVDFFKPRVLAAGGARSGRSSPSEQQLPTTAREGQQMNPQHGGARTAAEVMAALEVAAREWVPSLLRPMPELRFAYEQEPDAEEFFTPYLWSLVTAAMSLVDTSLSAQDEATGQTDAGQARETVSSPVRPTEPSIGIQV